MSALLLIALLGCEPSAGPDDPPADAEATEELVRRVLDDEAYRFCHEAGVFAEEALEWCPLLDDLPEDACPGLRETCSGAPPVALSAGCGEQAGGSASSSPAGRPDRPRVRRRPEACELPDSPVDNLASLLRWVVALMVALVVLVVLRVLWRYFGGRTDVPVVKAVAVVEPELDEAVLEDVPDLPSGDLLAASRAALAAGDFGRAVVLARGAALRRLADAGRLRLHRSRTDREYARALRKDPSVYSALRDVLGAVELHRWGGAALDKVRSEAAVAAADRILKAIGAVLLLVLLAGAPEARAQDDRFGPYGDAALLDLLNAWGHDAGFRLRGLDSLDDSVHVLVLDTTWVHPDEEGWSVVRTWVEQGGVLVVGGSCPYEELGERVELAGPAPTVGTDGLAGLGLPVPRWPDGARWARLEGAAEPWVVVDPPQGPVDPTGPDPVQKPFEGHAPELGQSLAVISSTPMGEGWVLAVADARLLWNGAFVHPDNEVFVGDVLHVAQGPLGWGFSAPARVELATTAAATSPTPTQSLLNADLLPFVIQLLITWSLLALWQGWPFGPLRDPPEAGRLSFADHVRSLGLRWQRLGSSRHALAAYGALWLQRLGPTGIRQAALRAGRDKHRAEALLTALQGAVEDPSGPDTEHDLEWMEELWTITDNR